MESSASLAPLPITPGIPRLIPSMVRDRSPRLTETIRRLVTGQHPLSEMWFSLKTLIAALLAYYIALSIQLERPFWSVITCYIVAQPLTGALLSKGVFRLVGTVIGAAVAVLLVPQLVDAPELLVLALALWLGACSYLAALDRRPRSYLALLAGYSAIIVALPTVDATDSIFEVAVARVQEIGIGILSVSLVHALLFPRPVWDPLRDRLDGILTDVGAWLGDALALQPRPQAVLWRDRRKLVSDLHDLHQLSTHLPYDMTSPAIVPARLRDAEIQLGLLLPLASAVEDRLLALGEAGDFGEDAAALDEDLVRLIEDVRGWSLPGAGQGHQALIARARALEPDLSGGESWPDLLRLSLLDRLASLVQAHAAARNLRDHLLDSAAGVPEAAGPAFSADEAGRRALHRDHPMALRAAATTTLTVITACAFWIATAWPEGAAAVVTAAILCALFSHLDVPVRAAGHAFLGTLGAAGAAGVFAFGLLPAVSSFEMLALLLSPFLLLLGWVLANPRRTPLGVGAVLAFPGLAGLGVAYDSSVETYANQALAQIFGSLLACLMLALLRNTRADTVARRLARAGWVELARRTRARQPSATTAWISRMLDRMVLLGPHLATLANGGALADDRLRDIRIGMALDDLQRVGVEAQGRQARQIAVIEGRLRQQLGRARSLGVLEADPRLSRAIEAALAEARRLPPSAQKRSLLLALVGLSRNLSF